MAKKRHQEEASSDGEVSQPIKKTKTKLAAEANTGKDDEGNSFWPLSNTRRVVIQKFKGKDFINIREYYESNGELRPGKKGIMLALEQYNALLEAIPNINAELQSKGHDLPTAFADAPSSSAPKQPAKSPSKEQKRKKKKMNIEATSDEESD
ncbi:transcriptional Coactivator p15-domain-containing protein [Nemania sp. FL0031]|nr:transcriptional Coactivator p15-domain-containing protein [Nemania sp. FL0031]